MIAPDKEDRIALDEYKYTVNVGDECIRLVSVRSSLLLFISCIENLFFLLIVENIDNLLNIVQDNWRQS